MIDEIDVGIIIIAVGILILVYSYLTNNIFLLFIGGLLVLIPHIIAAYIITKEIDEIKKNSY